MANSTHDPFTVEESLQMFADAIGVARSTVEARRWTASRWPQARRKNGTSFTVHNTPASVQDEDEWWAAIKDAPFNMRSGKRQWTTDGAKRLVGHQLVPPVRWDTHGESSQVRYPVPQYGEFMGKSARRRDRRRPRLIAAQLCHGTRVTCATP